MRTRNKFIAALAYWPLALPLLILLPGLVTFPYPGSGSPYSDFAITHYPNAMFLKTALASGALPLWSPQILSGFPFIAHPYSGIWYPPYWLALPFSLPFGLNLVLALHLVWAALGAYNLVRQSGLGHEASLLSGLAFAAAPKIFAHLGAGHLMLLLAVSWTPWLIFLSQPRASSKSRLAKLARPAVVLALILAADPRWAVYAAALWLAWVLYRRWPLRAIAGELLIAAGLAAPALLLYSQYGALSTRAALSAAPLELLLPPASLLGLLIPQWGGFHEWLIYPGVLVLLLSIVALPWRDAGRPDRFWLAILVVSIMLSLGDAVPGLRQLAALPGLSQLRVPPRSLFLASLAFAWLAGVGLQSLLEVLRPTRILRLVSVAFFTALTTVAILSWSAGSMLWQPAAWSALLVAVFLLLYELRSRNKLTIKTFALAVVAISLLDLLIIDASLVRTKPAGEVLGENSRAADFLAADPDLFRVYSPSFSISRAVAANRSFQLADGVDPLQIQRYAQFMALASGVPSSAYSVTLPPLAASADPATANAAYAPDAQILGLLNVKYIVSAFPLLSPGLTELPRIDSLYIYSNDFYRPRVWVETAAAGQVTDLRWNYNEIAVRAEGPGALVFSEIDYPGWTAAVDGAQVAIEPVHDILRSIQLEAGVHDVVLKFRPPALIPGLAISALTFASVLLPAKKRR